jgi:F-box and WD-40 domain protein 7
MDFCSLAKDKIPTDFFCPITKQVMVDPLMSRYGHSYERDAILTWLETHGCLCPLTRQRMAVSDLIQNRALKSRIHVWFRCRGLSNHLYDDSIKDGMSSKEQLPVEEHDIPKILLTCTKESLHDNTIKPWKVQSKKMETRKGRRLPLLHVICKR